MNLQNVLVTGGCGFIGSNFINFIHKEWPTVRVINLDLLRNGSSELNVEKFVRTSGRYQYVFGDYGDTNLVNKVLTDYHVDTVVHFAAVTNVDESFAQPLETIENNITKVMEFLQTITNYGRLRKFVHISTDEVYGDSMQGENAIGKKESDPLDPTNPYSASKAACEQLMHAYRHSFQLPVVILRMNNIYGPRQRSANVLPKFSRQFLMGQRFTIQGDGSQQRNFLYVLDACEGIRRIVAAGRVGEIYNLGSSRSSEVSVLQLAQMVQKVGAELSGIAVLNAIETVPIPDRPYNDKRYLMDSSKMKNGLGWEAKMPFVDGLKDTLRWYMAMFNEEESESKDVAHGVTNEIQNRLAISALHNRA